MNAPTPVRAVLFDLDGTLVQTRESSWVLFERTNREFALGIDTREEYFAVFKENMFVSLAKLVPDQAKRDAAIAHFLELLRREYAPPLVPGIADVVKTLAQTMVLGIVSTNSTEAIARVVRESGLESYFAHIFGGDIEPDKREAIRKFLADPSYATRRQGHDAYEEKSPRGLAPDEVVLVTDTVGDTLHARECGVRVIGVTWGLHEAGALRDAGAETIAHWPQELLSWLAPSIRAIQAQDAAGHASPAPADGGATVTRIAGKKHPTS
ncbi:MULTISPECIES: HAD family hydrolase [Pseudoxanthomonas]|mgnify:FL=1|uniref:phosphoglycolate phosphatase n=1 Tax=Pseudoxanthomonas winnipegensis TaxID=2480810 RepID=A0A4Q8M642_9GAMM|nr:MULTISPECIES: HAD family hydrolase [Pseudoxanthomonas]MDQ1120907.1 phosphoglycolate phosphatase [Pseudoxanthomonas winnipegensis]MDQ1134133.1 phosphoglycolate phosphatase [Pseudoxanthomonas winnipegensis]MDR6139629.1 phosphoglycolate phosphatase [Pseudoxanthomonas sp. SORGH_AS_0997]RZZ88462.1 HAD family hydrolase [Pseudoxanthomonas winnipegensis]TAA34749.1 HAD family hydrolase [Pseudoxanthomonas winnipegensis]